MCMGPASSLAIGVREDAPELRRALSEYVPNLRHSPTWNRLALKHFGDRAREILKRSRGE